MTSPFPEDSAARKTFPVFSGVLRYFPAAIAAVSHHSYLGNEKHNPGEAIHWARGKSDDHLDAAARHLTEGDLKGAAWRILAALQLEEEAKGAPMAPGARVVKPFPCAAEPSALDRYLISGAVQEDANFAARVGQPETPTVEFEADPVLQALIERSDEEAPLEGLTAGKAHMAEFGPNPADGEGAE